MHPSWWYTASAVVGIVFVSSVDTILNSFGIICRDLKIILWVEGKAIHLRTLDEKD